MPLTYTIIIFALMQCSVLARSTVPLFILDYDGVMTDIIVAPNPFEKITTAEFTEIIYNAKKNSKVIVLFIEDSLSFEDISIKNKTGTPFFNLRKGLHDKKVIYLPTVFEPFQTLRHLFHQQPSNVFHLSSMTTKLQVFDGKPKFFYIYFQDRDEDSRIDALRNHDLIIQEVYFAIRKIYAGPIVGFYTGKLNTVPVQDMNFISIKPSTLRRNPGVTVWSNSALFRLIGVYTITGHRRSMFSQIPVIAKETWTKHHLSTRMAYSDFDLQFNFEFKKESWMIDNIMLLEGGEEVGRIDLKAGAQWGYSYVCGEPLTIINLRDGSVVTISQYQIQPYQEKVKLFRSHIQRSDDEEALPEDSHDNEGDTETDTGTTKPGFGPSVNCGPYFNANILAALFVTFVCIGILTYGFLFIYNCNTNDRYDDPHGKPLTIPVEVSVH